MKPLQDITVLDFSQFLSGPSATLRMADLGARVIKVERPEGGDICRRLYISDLELDGDSTLFHSINRNKQSFAVDLKNGADRDSLNRLIAKADVVVQNFRPGVARKLGIAYEDVQRLNPAVVYGSISGYGDAGPWRNKPGQDLLVQSLSGLVWLTGDGDEPVPLGLSMVDMLAGAYLLQGILACLVRRGMQGVGGFVEVSMLETAVDMQTEEWTAFLNAGQSGQPVQVDRTSPWGIYATQDGYIALAAGDPADLRRWADAESRQLAAATPGSGANELAQADQAAIRALLRQDGSDRWLAALREQGIACGKVMTWPMLLAEPGFRQLDMTQWVVRPNGSGMTTLRCPIRIDGEPLFARTGSPTIGEHNREILRELGLN